ncbi:MAG: Ger(x)C family spore germination protein [Peptococcaceae bacterium]|nr:Ger(x)C family spore germination protein [Peptococcaceae bacterium]
MGKSLRRIGLVLVCNLLLTGCWDNIDVSESHYVTAMGIDRAPDGLYELTFEFPTPILTGQNKEGSGGGGGGEQKSVAVVTTKGDTLYTAARNIVEKLARKVIPSKMELLIINEQVARDGLMEVFDFMERQQDTNMVANILLVKGATAKEIMQVESLQEKIPSQHLMKSIKVNQDNLGTSKEARVIDIIKEVGLPGRDPLLPVIEIEQRAEPLKVKDLGITGSAVLKDGKLVGYLDGVQTKSWLLIEHKGKISLYSVPLAEAEGNAVFEVISTKATKKVEFLHDDKPKFIIELKVVGNIGESQVSIDLTQPERLTSFKAQVAQIIRKEIENTLLTSQQYQSDIFGFGSLIYKKHLTQWRKMQDNWAELYSKAPYEIEVTVQVKRSGYTRKSIEVK